jgi:hypothetical protein
MFFQQQETACTVEETTGSQQRTVTLYITKLPAAKNLRQAALNGGASHLGLSVETARPMAHPSGQEKPLLMPGHHQAAAMRGQGC